MEWTSPVTVLAALAVGATAIGALVTLVVRPLGGEQQMATAAVIGLLAVAVVGMVALGALGPGDNWLKNSGYW